MLSTVFVLAYAGIALMSMRMTFKEYQTNLSQANLSQANISRGRLGLLTGILACLLWPVVAFFLLLMLNLTAPSVNRVNQTI